MLLPLLIMVAARVAGDPNATDCEATFLNTADNLEVLSVRESGVECVPAVSNASDVRVLDLSLNVLKVLRGGAFRTFVRLEVLNLSGNALDTVQRDAFAGLQGLKCLDVSANNVSAFDGFVFAPLSSLQYLNLSYNRLEVLDEDCFAGLQRLQQLDVSWNRLRRIGTLELPSLARLVLEGNPRLGALFVGTGRRLQLVDASRTGLKQVPSALTHSIRTLRLSNNSITAVSCGDLDSYPLLQLLDFTNNKLADVEEDALGRLDSLTILYLTDNRLELIPHSLPEKLRVLHLENNRIRSVASGDLQGLPQLEVLLLSGNLITAVENPFIQLPTLSTLDLSRNPIAALPSDSLAGPSRLRVLRLASLALDSPAEELQFPLPNPEYLITLDLAHSPGLARQILADDAALAAARELQEFDLTDTRITTIRSDLLHHLPQLRALRILDNPFNCTDLQWLAEWLRRQDLPDDRRITCASPPELWGTPLVDLQTSEGNPATPPPSTSQPITTLVMVEENATIPAEPSRFSGMKKTSHPGMLILTAGVLCCAVLVTLTARIRRRGGAAAQSEEDIEVSSLPSVTELW